MGLKKQFRKV